MTPSRETRPRPRRRLPRPGAAVPHRPAGPGDGPTGEEATGPLAEGVAPRPPAQSVSQSVSRSNSYNTSKRAYTGVRRSVRDATIRLVRGSGPSHSAPQPEADFHNTHIKCPAGIKGHPKSQNTTLHPLHCGVCVPGGVQSFPCAPKRRVGRPRKGSVLGGGAAEAERTRRRRRCRGGGGGQMRRSSEGGSGRTASHAHVGC